MASIFKSFEPWWEYAGYKSVCGTDPGQLWARLQ